MNRTRLSLTLGVAVAAIVAIIVASGGGSTKAHAAGAANSAVSISQTSLGKTLVDANGRTLYLFQGDKANVSTLSAAGQAVWPPFTATVPPKAQNGAVAADIGTITTAAGTTQVTYNGHPLYYYVADKQPGQTKGQSLNEFGALWYVLAPSGSAIASAPSAPAPAASTTPSYAY